MDFLSSERLIDPCPDYANRREHRPIWWAEGVQGRVVSRYDDVRAVLKIPSLFSSKPVGEGAQQVMAPPLLTDAPPRLQYAARLSPPVAEMRSRRPRFAGAELKENAP